MATEITRKAKQASTTRTPAKRTTTAKKGTRKRKELTAKEATLRAWQLAYENRHRRLT